MFFDVEICHHVTPAQGKRNDGASRFDAWQRPNTGEKLIEEGDHVFVFWIGCTGQLDTRGKESFRLHARRHTTEAREALNQQAGADEHDQRERDLGYNESVAQTMFMFAAGAGARSGF